METTSAHHGASKGTLPRTPGTSVWRWASVWRWIIVVVWLLSSATGLWIFQTRDRRTFENSVTLFDASARTAAAEAWYHTNLVGTAADTGHVAATVVHFYRQGCSCNRFTEPHLAKLIARYRQEGVRFVLATREQSTTHGLSIGDLPQYTIPAQHDLDWLDAAPAALVYDPAGKLVYFGPYSDAAWCGASGGLVERVLDGLLAGQIPHLRPFYGSGCFCSTRHAGQADSLQVIDGK
jgi:hypothetical protein